MQNSDKKDIPIYSESVIEFVTVAAEYCASIEGCQGSTRKEFIDRINKISSLLYLKALLLPDIVCLVQEGLQAYVDEYTYENVREKISATMGEYDFFLETQNSDMQYSDTPISATISEHLADVYQDLRDMIENFKTANEEVMTEAIFDCKEGFANDWGQKLINAISAMHCILYSDKNEGQNSDEDFFEVQGDDYKDI